MKPHLIFVFLISSILSAKGDGQPPLLELNDGHTIPGFGLGTWLGFSQEGRVKPKGTEVQHAVEWAIDAGYRHIDTAHIYDTETQVGKGLKNKIAEGKAKREDLFITTKLWNDRHAKEEVEIGLRESLTKLGLDYVDLYLIHWPVATFPNNSANDAIDYVETWRGMMEVQKLGLAKSIGVSNFNQQLLERLITETGVKPAVLQVELNLNLQQPSLLSYCQKQNIRVMAYTPFGSLFYNKAAPDAPPPRIDDPQLVEIAKKYNKTVPQIALRYLVELGVIPIPKTVTKSRVEENFQIFDFQLNEEEKNLLKSYDRQYRTIAVKWWIDSQYYPFERN